MLGGGGVEEIGEENVVQILSSWYLW